MNWKTYYDRFYAWEESTRLRYLSDLTDFGPSSEVCELAVDFLERKHADRLIRKALDAKVSFTFEEVSELNGLVDERLMFPLMRSVRSLSPEELDDLSYLLTKEELRMLAEKHGIRLDGFGFVITREDELLEEEFRREEEQARIEDALWEKELEEEIARREEELLLARFVVALAQQQQIARWKKRRGK